LEHRLGVTVDDAVALHPADAIAHVVKGLSPHGRAVDSVLNGGVGVGRALGDRRQQHAHAVFDLLSVPEKEIKKYEIDVIR
jgi:hypothetical protein